MPARPVPALALLCLCALVAVPSASAFSTTGVDLQNPPALGAIRALVGRDVCDLIGGSGPMPDPLNLVQVMHNEQGAIEGVKEWVPNGGLQYDAHSTAAASSSGTADAPTLQGTWVVQALCSVLTDDPCLKDRRATVACLVQADSMPSWAADLPGPFTLLPPAA